MESLTVQKSVKNNLAQNEAHYTLISAFTLTITSHRITLIGEISRL